MGVHGLGAVHVTRTQAHVLKRFEIPAKSLDIAPVDHVCKMSFDYVIDIYGSLESLVIPRRRKELGQGIDAESLCIQLCLVDQSLPSCIQRPVYASVLVVHEVGDKVILGVDRHDQMLLAIEPAVQGGICPKDARVEDGSSGSVLLQRAVPGDTPEEPALRILQPLPERQNVVFQDIVYVLHHLVSANKQTVLRHTQIRFQLHRKDNHFSRFPEAFSHIFPIHCHTFSVVTKCLTYKEFPQMTTISREG